MIRGVVKLAAVFLVVFLLAACRTPIPPYDISAAPISPPAASLADVQKAISRGGVKRGWQMTPVSPGRMQGTLVVREHRAVVDITYDTKTYNIKYKDSTNLQYDGKSIHANYNKWVQDLDREIRMQLVQ